MFQHDEGSEVRASGHLIVLDDPEGVFWEGGIITEERLRSIAGGASAGKGAREVATLPVEPVLFGANAIAGYFRRGWGGGYPLATDIPKVHCPMALFLSQRHRTVNWKARILPTKGAQIGGLLRLAQDSSQHHSLAGGLSASDNTPVDLGTLGEPDSRGGWTIGGKAQIHAPSDGFAGFGLYGTGRGLRVLWAAITQTP